LDEVFDIAIVGAGIVGLAVGAEILRRYPDCRLLVLEKEDAVAAHQSSHNSGVVHSGIYYKPGSLKARLCVRGAQAMLEFVKSRGIPYLQCGKVIVAADQAEIARLEEIYRRGKQNGVPGLRWLPDSNAIRELEPHAAGICGIHVPSTAITDFKMVAEEYAKLITTAGGTIRCKAGVTAIRQSQDETVIGTQAGEFRAKYLVNCAGLHSDRIARLADEKPDVMVVPFRGEYYELLPHRHDMVRGLIYPVPDTRFPFLGVHFTRRVHGGVEAGPNAVLALRREGYTRTSFSLRDSLSNASFGGFWKMAWRYWGKGMSEMYRSWNKTAFTRALKKMLPEIESQDLRPGGAGVRAQAIDDQGKLVDDFKFSVSARALHVINVPSPAATASLKIAEELVNLFSPHLRAANRAVALTRPTDSLNS
jgi:(S)-2-hydroxyglutarate dehydrogenase